MFCYGDVLSRRCFVKEMFCHQRLCVPETICDGDVLYGDVLCGYVLYARHTEHFKQWDFDYQKNRIFRFVHTCLLFRIYVKLSVQYSIITAHLTLYNKNVQNGRNRMILVVFKSPVNYSNVFSFLNWFRHKKYHELMMQSETDCKIVIHCKRCDLA
jgi:hypothetical protein